MRNLVLIGTLLVAGLLGITTLGCHNSDNHPYHERKETDVIRGKQPSSSSMARPTAGHGMADV